MNPNCTERSFQQQVIRLAEQHGWYVYHVSNVRGQLRAKTSVGFPDLVLARGGQVLIPWNSKQRRAR